MFSPDPQYAHIRALAEVHQVHAELHGTLVALANCHNFIIVEDGPVPERDAVVDRELQIVIVTSQGVIVTTGHREWRFRPRGEIEIPCPPPRIITRVADLERRMALVEKGCRVVAL